MTNALGENWDTTEVISWYLNDEEMYNKILNATSFFELKKPWRDRMPNPKVMMSKVDWHLVKDHFELDWSKKR